MSTRDAPCVPMGQDNDQDGGAYRVALGRAIRTRRMQLGLTQEKLGMRAGLDRTYVSGLERGERNPSLDSLRKVARALQWSPSELLDAAESQGGS